MKTDLKVFIYSTVFQTNNDILGKEIPPTTTDFNQALGPQVLGGAMNILNRQYVLPSN